MVCRVLFQTRACVSAPALEKREAERAELEEKARKANEEAKRLEEQRRKAEEEKRKYEEELQAEKANKEEAVSSLCDNFIKMI